MQDFPQDLSSSQDSNFTEQRFLAAEVLASVVWNLFPNVVLKGGGLHSLGFYYDFIFQQPLTESMVELIEVHFHRFIKEGHLVRSISMMRENAQTLFEHHEHFLLAERAGEQHSNILDLVQIGSFYGLCPSLSLSSTDQIGHIKLLETLTLVQDLEGEDIVITRFIGTVQGSAKDAKKFWKNYESFLKKKDHRLLGPQLRLFSFSESMGDLGVIWHPKGLQVRQILLEWVRKQLPEEELQIATPLAVRQNFLEKFPQPLEPFLFENQEYCLRPSLLQQHLEFLEKFPLENEAFPWRVNECTPIFRPLFEFQKWGLLSQCAYMTEQTTICCFREQLISELIYSLIFIEQIITIFGFEAQWYLVASRQKSPKARQEREAVQWLKQVIEIQPLSYPVSSKIQEEEGEGPRLELRIRDVLGREWPVSRVGVIPPTLPNGAVLSDKQNCVILTRQIWESLDCFIALLIERYEGVFPFWLAPEQVRVMAIGEANQAYARQISQDWKRKGLRVKLDIQSAKLSLRIHEAEKEKIPYLVLIGEQERIKQKISVRAAERLNQSQSIDSETFFNRIYQESLSPIIPRSPILSRKWDEISGESKSLES